MSTHVTSAGGNRVPFRRFAAILGALLAIQVIVPLPERNLQASASWVNLASSLEDAKKLSEVIVVGRVVRTEAADDIVVPARGEPNDVDRVGAEAVTVVVDRTYKGNAQGAIQLFHTKLESEGASPVPLTRSASPPANRATPAPPTETETRRVLLDGDPPYQTGEQYLLFLTRGPVLKQHGVEVPTLAVIAPEGRYLLFALGADRANPQLRALTKRGFAPEYDGRPASELFSALGTLIAAGSTSRPKNRRGRTTTIVAAGIGAAIAGGLLASSGRKQTGTPNGTTTATGAGGSTGTVNPSTATTRSAGSLGIPQNLSPGSTSYEPGQIPSFQTSVMMLTWQPPPSSEVSSYLVELENVQGGEVTRYSTSEQQQIVRLALGTYRWNVRAIDTSGRQGRPAQTRYFSIVEPRSVLH